MYFSSWPFRIVPERSAHIWADRKELYDNLENTLLHGVQRKRSLFCCVWGYLGAGKSHSLMHFAGRLREENVYSIVAPFPRGVKRYEDLYRQSLMKPLNFLDVAKRSANLWESFCKQGVDTKSEMRALETVSKKITEGWLDIAQVFLTLGRTFYLTGQIQAPLCLLAQSWLSGNRLTKREMQKLGVSSYLKEGSDFVKATQSLVHLLTYREQECAGFNGLVWTLDDCHVLATLRGKRDRKRLETIEQNLRDVFDYCPNGLIIVLSFASRDRSRVNDLLIGDIQSRITKWIEIPPLLKSEAKKFILDLIHDEKVQSKNCSDSFYPYTEDGIDWIIAQIENQTDLTPRNIMKFLDYITSKAEEEIFPKKITVDFLEKLQAFEPFQTDAC